MRRTESYSSALSEPEEIAEGDWEQKDAFNEDTGDGSSAGLFSQQTVYSECQTQRNGDPREATVPKCKK